MKATKTNSKKVEGTHSLAIKKPTVTGKFCFQFDGDEPFEIMEVFDSQELNLKLASPTVKEGEATLESEITFEKGGKKFRLFIKAV